VLTMLGSPPRIRPLLVSKLNTALQIALAALALVVGGYALDLDGLLWVMIWLVAATTFTSGAAYVILAAWREDAAAR